MDTFKRNIVQLSLTLMIIVNIQQQMYMYQEDVLLMLQEQ